MGFEEVTLQQDVCWSQFGLCASTQCSASKVQSFQVGMETTVTSLQTADDSGLPVLKPDGISLRVGATTDALPTDL